MINNFKISWRIRMISAVCFFFVKTAVDKSVLPSQHSSWGVEPIRRSGLVELLFGNTKPSKGCTGREIVESLFQRRTWSLVCVWGGDGERDRGRWSEGQWDSEERARHSSQKHFQPRRGQSNQFNQPLIGWNGKLLTGWRDWKLKVRMEMCSFVDNRNNLWKLKAVFGRCTLYFF